MTMASGRRRWQLPRWSGGAAAAAAMAGFFCHGIGDIYGASSGNAAHMRGGPGDGHGVVVATLTFWMRIFSGLVPTCAAMSFLRSPMVSSSFTLTRTFFPSRSLQMISIMALRRDGGGRRKLAAPTKNY